MALFRDLNRSTDPSDTLALAQSNLRLPKPANDLVRRAPFPCHSTVSFSEGGNSRIRSVNLGSLLGGRLPDRFLRAVGITPSSISHRFPALRQDYKDAFELD